MTIFATILDDVSLPNATTWLYFSALLVFSLFVRYSQVFSLRNWDLFTLFLLAPGLLILQEAHAVGQLAASPGVADVEGLSRQAADLRANGYMWLMVGSFYFFCRCILDLGLEKRPPLSANLNLSGLTSLTAALFLCLTTVAVRRLPDTPPEMIGKTSLAIMRLQDGTKTFLQFQVGDPDLGAVDVAFWVERGVAMLLHLAIVLGLVGVGRRHFGGAAPGVAAACLYLLLPYTAYHITQIHHLWPAAFLVWAIYCYRSPVCSGILLGIAGATTFFPLLMVPMWVGFYRKRGAGRFLFAFLVTVGVMFGGTALVLMYHGEFARAWSQTLALADWQAWKAPRTESIWSGTTWAYRLPVFVAYAVFVVITSFWPSPRTLSQLIAQMAAVAIGVQFWYADRGGVYVHWYLPLLLLMMFRPTLAEDRPPEIELGPGLFSRLAGWAGRRVRDAELIRRLVPRRGARAGR